MDMNLFIDRVLEAAKAEGIETAEVYYTAGENFRAAALDGEINQYQVSASANLSLRGTVNGKMGYCSTQAFDDAAIQQLVEGVKESAALFIGELGIDGTVDTVAAEINAMMGENYKKNVPAKPHVEGYLKMLKAKGVRMCVASATVEALIDACLERLGLLHYFEFSLSCDTVGMGKSSPLVYQEAARRMGARADEAAVYEDSLLASNTAKDAGFYLCVVADPANADTWDSLCAIGDEALESWIV